VDRQRTATRPAPKDWHKADIKAALEKGGWTFRSLASHLEVSHAALTSALIKPYPASERRIAEAIGVHPMVLWPSRYDEDGKPINRRCNPYWAARRNRSTRAARGNVKKARPR